MEGQAEVSRIQQPVRTIALMPAPAGMVAVYHDDGAIFRTPVLVLALVRNKHGESSVVPVEFDREYGCDIMYEDDDSGPTNRLGYECDGQVRDDVDWLKEAK